MDSSALGKLYVEEDGTATVRAILNRRGGSLFASDFVMLEVLTAIRTALRDEPAAVYATALAQFRTIFLACTVCWTSVPTLAVSRST